MKYFATNFSHLTICSPTTHIQHLAIQLLTSTIRLSNLKYFATNYSNLTIWLFKFNYFATNYSHPALCYQTSLFLHFVQTTHIYQILNKLATYFITNFSHLTINQTTHIQHLAIQIQVFCNKLLTPNN